MRQLVVRPQRRKILAATLLAFRVLCKRPATREDTNAASCYHLLADPRVWSPDTACSSRPAPSCLRRRAPRRACHSVDVCGRRSTCARTSWRPYPGSSADRHRARGYALLAEASTSCRTCSPARAHWCACRGHSGRCPCAARLRARLACACCVATCPAVPSLLWSTQDPPREDRLSQGGAQGGALQGPINVVDADERSRLQKERVDRFA